MITTSVSGSAVPRMSRKEVGEWVEQCVRAIKRAGAATVDASELSVAFVDDAAMKKLNRQYRGKSSTTDVLTFPAEDTDSPDTARQLGDIVISVAQARRQAREEGHSLATEIRYLLLHGILHAYGYDHEADRGEMNELEMKVRKRVGLH